MSLVVGMDNLFFSSRSLTVVDPAFTVTVDWEGGWSFPLFRVGGRHFAALWCHTGTVVSYNNCSWTVVEKQI